MLDPALPSALLEALDTAGAGVGLTPGDLRQRLARFRRGITMAEIQDGLHALWSQDRITVEPPPPGKREFRVRLASPALAERLSAPESGGETGPEDSLESACGQLAAAFHEAKSAETKQELARLLFNFGARRPEPDGSRAAFQGRRHVCPQPILPGAPVKVTEAGWCLPARSGGNPSGERLLSKSRVAPA